MLVTWQIQSETDVMVCKSLCAIFIHPAMMLAVTVVRVQRATSIYVFARVHQLVGGFDQSHTQSGGVNRCGLKDTSAWPGALNRQPRRGLTCRFPPRPAVACALAVSPRTLHFTSRALHPPTGAIAFSHPTPAICR